MKNSARGDSSTGSELKAVEEACREASRTVEACELCVSSVIKLTAWLRLCRAMFLVEFGVQSAHAGHGRFLHVNRGDTPPDDRWRFLSPPARSPRTVAWRRDSEAGSGNPRARSPHRCPFDPVLRLRLSPCARPTSPARLKTSSLAGRRWKF
jgi:hypothetical protein